MIDEDRNGRWKYVLGAAFLLTSTAYGATMTKPDIKLNPTPRMRYEITAIVDGAPGAFDTISGHVDYKVTNEDCVPMTPVMGATIPPEKRLPLTFSRVDGNEFKAVVFIDQIQDEDYFGKGICRWSVVAAGPELHHGEVNFSPAIYHDDIVGQHAVVRHFSIKSFQNADRQRIDIGADKPTAFNDPNATFRITLKAVEKTQ